MILANPNKINMVPTITCNPWRPVETKKAEPKAPSVMLNGACIYSNPCKAVNTIAKIIVIKVPSIAALLLPLINAWCP